MSSPQPDYAASVAFLEQWMPGGPWVLVALGVDKKAIDVGRFGGNDVKSGDLLKWLTKHGAKRNCYFVPNPCRDSGENPPLREHMTCLSFLHVDLDPRAGEDLAEEQARMRALLFDPPHLGISKPTCVVFSGGGLQAFWRLAVPEPLDGSAEKYEEAKRWNKQLELVLGGDNTHNINRLMRLPGTINRPDARKREKKRVEALAEVVEFNDTLHDLTKFTKAEPERAARVSSNGAAPAVTFDAANVARVEDLDAELPPTVPPVVKRIIACGRDEENGEPEREGWSRSEWQWWATCELARRGVKPEVTYSILIE